MASEPKGQRPNEQTPRVSKLTKTFEQQFLQQVIDNSYDSLFVTDKFGNVLLVNAGSGIFMDYKTEDLIGDNVKNFIQKGIYDWSPTLEAIKTRSVVSGIMRNAQGIQHLVTSKPLFDENGDITLIITNGRNEDLEDNYMVALEKERKTVRRYKTAVEYLSEKVENKEPVAESQQMRNIIQLCNIIARTDSTVMLIGETGTGKEVIARHIHRNSLRSTEPFIPVNCAAIPNELLESEFFGYARGAFTGANPQGKPGLFEIADKGTLFLDEIAELPLAMQSKLLRVIETSQIQRLGDTKIHQTNVRFITATNRDLNEMISQKLFRSDLYYRLNVIPVNLPPLRDRSDDIIAFANKFLEELNRKYGLRKTFSSKATQALLNYSWPGNVRELRNVIERLVITSSSDIINFENDSLVKSKTPNEILECSPETKRPFQGTLKSVKKAVAEKYIAQVLADCGGQVSEAALRLGIHSSVLYRKRNKYR